MIKRDSWGFTFVEILAALAFLGILLPVVVSGLTLANRTSVVAERVARATELAESRLGEMMIGDAWATGESRGDFGDSWSGYRWELSQGAWEAGDMTELTLSVHFSVQGREQEVRLTTLVSSVDATTAAP